MWDLLGAAEWWRKPTLSLRYIFFGLSKSAMRLFGFSKICLVLKEYWIVSTRGESVVKKMKFKSKEISKQVKLNKYNFTTIVIQCSVQNTVKTELKVGKLFIKAKKHTIKSKLSFLLFDEYWTNCNCFLGAQKTNTQTPTF